ncbi:hypothetical protein Btru_020374 [Bulinus truncatus]|nr:hypothetical protein Btru_020374 [Bulinus truncatus]
MYVQRLNLKLYLNIPLPHGRECNVRIDHCEDGTFCLPDRNKFSRCLCKEDQYRTKFNSCLSTSNLLVTEVITKRVTPNSATIEWSNRTIYTESAKFKVSYGNSPYVYGNDRGITIYKLEQDTTYNFTIQVVMPSDAWYSARDGPKYFHIARTSKFLIL